MLGSVYSIFDIVDVCPDLVNIWATPYQCGHESYKVSLK